jgi:hypothetical protein
MIPHLIFLQDNFLNTCLDISGILLKLATWLTAVYVHQGITVPTQILPWLGYNVRKANTAPWGRWTKRSVSLVTIVTDQRPRSHVPQGISAQRGQVIPPPALLDIIVLVIHVVPLLQVKCLHFLWSFLPCLTLSFLVHPNWYGSLFPHDLVK